MFGQRTDWRNGTVFPLDRQFLRSLSGLDLSGTQRLAVAQYKPPTAGTVGKSAPYHILSHMKDLRTLTLTQCNSLPFILALNPNQNASKCALCPKLEELVIYVEGLDSFNIEELMSMVKGWASVGTNLSSITIIGLGELMLGKVFRLKQYVPHVEYRVGEEPPEWDAIPGDKVD